MSLEAARIKQSQLPSELHGEGTPHRMDSGEEPAWEDTSSGLGEQGNKWVKPFGRGMIVFSVFVMSAYTCACGGHQATSTVILRSRHIVF